MEYGKYVIVKFLSGIEIAILFDCICDHSAIVQTMCDCVVSAGRFVVGSKPTEEDPDDIEVSVFGHSITLGKEPRVGQDERIIKRVLRKNWGI